MLQLDTLIKTIDNFYEITKIPLCFLNQNDEILQQPDNFYQLPIDFYQNILSHDLVMYGKITISYSNSDIAFFIPYESATIKKICIGPLLFPNTNQYKNKSELLFLRYLTINYSLQDVLKKITYFNENTFAFIRIFYLFLTNEAITIEDVRKILHQDKQSKNNILVSETIINKRDYDHKIYTYLEEQKFLHTVIAGDSITARTYAAQLINIESELLSDNEFRSNKNKIISAITLTTRAVIKAGVSLEASYATSDTYIRKIDHSQTPFQLHEIFMNCIIDFCTLVKTRKHDNYPFWIKSCMEFIDQNLHREASLIEISEHLHMSASYISVQFKKMTGISITDYINKQKVEEAKFLLQYTQMNILEISANLNFSSPSYFTKIFKKHEGILPRDYKGKFYR